MWAVENCLTPKGDPLDFKDHPYLIDIYEDTSEEIVIQKSAQTGLSTFAINRAFWFGDTHNISVIYTFPTVGDATEFSKTRVKPIVRASPHLMSKIADVDSVELKQIGESFIYFRGTWTETEALSIDSDLNIHDETDRSKPEIISMYKERLSHSKYGHIIHLSNPSIPQFGINALYHRSDMKKWLVPCSGCGKEQVLRYPDSIKGAPSEEIYQCLYCEAEITDLDRKQGRWQPSNPGAKISGYHVTQLIAPWIGAADIAQKQRDEKWPQTFHNFVLGEPYAGENVPIKRTQLLECVQNTYSLESEGRNTHMGVDQGDLLHATIWKRGEEDDVIRLVWCGVLDSFDELPNLMDRYQVVSCVIDAGPNKHSARRFALQYPGKVWLCYYSENQKEELKWKDNPDVKEWSVTAHKTETLDAVAARILNHQIILPKITQIVDDYIRQMCNIAKDMVTKPDGTVVWRYKAVGPDHFAQATNYASIALSRGGAVGSFEGIWEPTPDAYRPITAGLLKKIF